ncbi:hypothetical protein [Haloechinothrix salitolerans]|uniref:Uncharacterized protein n=1 Tax=Haloechinothrix salitolerans TaxID=926830 RepID=A0ABW2C405_9PSEU
MPILATYSTGVALTLHSVERAIAFPCFACQQQREATIVALHRGHLVCPRCHPQLVIDVGRADGVALRWRQGCHLAPVFRDFPLYDTADSSSTLTQVTAR